MKPTPCLRRTASVFLVAAAAVVPTFATATDVAPDYGLGAFATLADWTSGVGTVPMDYGVGSFATLEAWRAASVGGTTLASR